MSAIRILHRFFPIQNHVKRIRLNYLFKAYLHSEEFQQNTLLRGFIEEFRKHVPLVEAISSEGSDLMQLAGLGFLACSYLLCLAMYDKIVHPEYLVNIAISYIYVDYILDSCNDEEISNYVKIVKRVMEDDIKRLKKGEEVDPELVKLHPSLVCYRKIVDGRLGVAKAAKKLFETELKSVTVQRNPNNTKEDYRKICRDKGGYTGVLLFRMLNETDIPKRRNIPESNLFDIGYCAQLIDDFIDVHLDIKSGVSTLATYEYQKYGNLDDYLDLTFREIYKIKPYFRLAQLIFCCVMLYAVSKGDVVTSKTFRRVEPFIVLDQRYGTDVESEFSNSIGFLHF